MPDYVTIKIPAEALAVLAIFAIMLLTWIWEWLAANRKKYQEYQRRIRTNPSSEVAASPE